MQNKIYIGLLVLLVTLTSFMFFFVRFSIDTNKDHLLSLSTLSENQQLHLNALNSNTMLANTSLLAFTASTCFVFFMFYYKLLKDNRREIGIIKSLGYKDRIIRHLLSGFTFVLSFISSIIGLIIGYFGSTILQNAYKLSYLVENLEKGINISTFFVGTILITLIFTGVTYASYYLVQGQDIACLMTRTPVKQNKGKVLSWVHSFPIRLAMRKPISLLLILISVITFSIMFVMGISLDTSAKIVYDSQLTGHNYEYDTELDTFANKQLDSPNILYYIETNGRLSINGKPVKQTIIGIESAKVAKSTLLELETSNKERLGKLNNEQIFINEGLLKTYGLDIGDIVTLHIQNRDITVTVQNIASNAKQNCLYIERSDLATLLGAKTDAYNGLLSNEIVLNEGNIIPRDEKIATLERNTISNKTSAKINHVIGFVLGAILIYLALLVNFQESTRDMLILRLLGYNDKQVKKMLIDLYKPIIAIFYVAGLYPSILIAKNIQKGFSISTNDYMPFYTNIALLAGVFVILFLVYYAVQWSFSWNIKQIFKKEDINSYTQ